MEGCGRKRSWSNLRYYTGISLETFWRNTKSVMITEYSAEFEPASFIMKTGII